MSIKKILLVTIFSFISLNSLTAFAEENISKSAVMNIQHWQTTNGIPVYFVQAKQLPMLDLAVTFRAGSAYDNTEFGLANFTGELLNQGTSQLNADQIAAEFDRLGANFSSGVTRDMASISLRTLVKPELLNPSVDLFTKIITQPSFPKDAFSREQNMILRAITADLESPETVASKAFIQNLYGSYPYAHPVIGKTDTIAKITPEQIQAFYKKYYVAQNAIISMVGDLDLNQAKNIAEKVAIGISQGEKAPGLGIPTQNKGQSININYDATQTYIYMGQLGIAYNDPDYFPLVVGNYSLGGGMVSRLFDIVREKNGLTYGISSYFQPLATKGPFVISLQTRTSKTQDAIKLTKDVVANFINQGPSDKELQDAKQYILGSFPLRIDSNSDILNYLTVIGFYNLPLDFLDTYRDKIRAVTLSQIKDALHKRLDVNNMLIVAVGKTTQENETVKNTKKT